MKKIFYLRFFLILLIACESFSPDFSIPQYTLRTYVYAYNQGNGKLLRRCGMATDLDSAFTKLVKKQDGEEIVIPVENIQYKVKDIQEGEMSVSKYSAVRRVWLDVEFTSSTDPEYYLRKTILFEEKRLPFESKTVWQIH
ncbi:hypothetical protein KKB18_10095 [bacterium]|nr:hypothetical protein [bacterium]